ncbi:lytic polysaccharide monooxygenase auxiliary activity family 9 protein [Erwinia sp. HR93]|uniref:lytic polysaccharide monooxygenase auxiliary activity family 9 protein n=1 Tax=Erwinia sp. HR93 TaxID=3094840 RepID=UPI002ADED0CC|nr:lytic polysaccharide monooxygenase auxiliary activity family 9 protein [Erwinia sp. HR93]MEA1063480.1 lytic polysaccharide monooxygenase auxiliary activity family 9 protein [Erwinia sp. HR93]
MSIDLKHGRVTSPKTRGLVATELGLIGEWQNNEMEGGKNFPATTSGSMPAPFESDAPSTTPPADGLILSGGKTDARECVNFTDSEMAEQLGKAFEWPCVSVTAGETLKIHWAYTAAHTTRGYRAFITKDGWDATQRISRAQLEEAPFFEDIYPYVPFSQYPDKLVAKTEHDLVLPKNKRGHHVIVLLWLVADTGNAFYQALDVDFG